MVRETSELLSGLGRSFEVLKAIIDAVLRYGGSDEDILRVLKDSKLKREVATTFLCQKLLEAPEIIDGVMMQFRLLSFRQNKSVLEILAILKALNLYPAGGDELKQFAKYGECPIEKGGFLLALADPGTAMRRIDMHTTRYDFPAISLKDNKGGTRPFTINCLSKDLIGAGNYFLAIAKDQ